MAPARFFLGWTPPLFLRHTTLGARSNRHLLFQILAFGILGARAGTFFIELSFSLNNVLGNGYWLNEEVLFPSFLYSAASDLI